jgi:CRP-like cAMP-binding protein
MEATGLTEDSSFALGLTQADLGDVLGVTYVHVNRTLRELRNKGLVRIGGKRATIPDRAALCRVADFDPTYLQMCPPASK